MGIRFLQPFSKISLQERTDGFKKNPDEFSAVTP